jgi:hypothetical protein
VPATPEGWACWQAADASLRGGAFSAPHLDLAAAMALAEAAGVPRAAAADLLRATQAGLMAGLAKREGKA